MPRIGRVSMRFLYLTAAFFSVVLWPFAIYAHPPRLSPQSQVKIAAANYIASISCSKPSNILRNDDSIISTIHLIISKKSYLQLRDPWAVIFTAGMMDNTHNFISCTGGNGNSPTYILIVEKGDFGYFVDPRRSFPVVKFNEPLASVRHVVSNKPNSLTLTGMDYGPHDSLAGPSEPKTITMSMDLAGDWTVAKPPS